MPLFDLSTRLKLRLTGSDRVRFLNGQITNDVRKANGNLSMPACVLNAKGKVDGFIFVTANAEDLFIDADEDERETLPSRLERYLIADDVTIEDVTEKFALFHVAGEGGSAPPDQINWRRAKRFGTIGWDLVIPAAEHDRILQLLSATNTLCDAECAERWRIEQGVPRWGYELTAQIIPVEANLADEAIDYGKGCYIGQEVISRMKMSGQINKRLCGLVSLEDSRFTLGTRLLSPDEAKDAGWITSATRSNRLGKEIALGYVKRGFNQRGTKLLAEQQHVEVVELPFL